MFKISGHVNYNLPIIKQMQNSFVTGLKLKNSLTNELVPEEFIPIEGQNVTWYTCGPTVYSDSHMGHARNYICNDMIRRVMRDHFGYNVKLAMNITDVEDKIINRSREENIQYFKFAQKWEAEFFDDMKNLNVELPDYITRVTQYIPDIIKFIERIVDNGYGYESNGSVYFDIQEYKKKFKYGKLKRIKKAETEAEETNEAGEKKNKEDFALWKAAKPDEPRWNSKWGDGRPGWHIECSTMACGVFGQKIDIHSGGIDLIFPHHENQIAQTEAHYNEPGWIKYFFHIGHLHIDGCKMSKSLKNFITIKQLLKHFSPQVIRLFFFMHKYDVELDYDPENAFQETEVKEKKYKSFFGTLKAMIRDKKVSDPQKIDQTDLEFDKFLEEIKAKVHEAFCNNFHTPGVIKTLDDGIKRSNIYMSGENPKAPLLIKAFKTLNKPFESMGLFYTHEDEQVKEQELLNAIVKFRDRIRENAKSDFKGILGICDAFRDEDMVELGIRLEDKQIGEPSIWKHESKQVLIREREKKLEAIKKKEEEKKAKELQKLEKMKINPRTMFLKNQKYTQFDENGIPTHEKFKEADRQINDKLRNKLNKEWNAQKEQYDKYVELYGLPQEKIVEKNELKKEQEAPKKQE